MCVNCFGIELFSFFEYQEHDTSYEHTLGNEARCCELGRCGEVKLVWRSYVSICTCIQIEYRYIAIYLFIYLCKHVIYAYTTTITITATTTTRTSRTTTTSDVTFGMFRAVFGQVVGIPSPGLKGPGLLQKFGVRAQIASLRGPRDHINTRILPV